MAPNPIFTIFLFFIALFIKLVRVIYLTNNCANFTLSISYLKSCNYCCTQNSCRFYCIYMIKLLPFDLSIIFGPGNDSILCTIYNRTLHNLILPNLVRIIYFYYLFFHHCPTHKLCFLSCRPFIIQQVL